MPPYEIRNFDTAERLLTISSISGSVSIFPQTIGARESSISPPSSAQRDYGAVNLSRETIGMPVRHTHKGLRLFCSLWSITDFFVFYGTNKSQQTDGTCDALRSHQ